jgi:hypothetical protein
LWLPLITVEAVGPIWDPRSVGEGTMTERILAQTHSSTANVEVQCGSDIKLGSRILNFLRDNDTEPSRALAILDVVAADQSGVTKLTKTELLQLAHIQNLLSEVSLERRQSALTLPLSEMAMRMDLGD